MAEYKLLFKHTDDPAYKTLAGYQKTGGYAGLKKAVKMERQAVCEVEAARASRAGSNGTDFPKRSAVRITFCATPTKASRGLLRTNSFWRHARSFWSKA